jgi:hypothetical protein
MKTAPLDRQPKLNISANKINHVTLVLDTSASMRGREGEVVTATDALIQFLARRSQELDQETRITVYLFDMDADCVIYDKDVLRMPSLLDVYHATGPATNLLGATIKAVDESKDISERYGDHAFLFYVFTDGHENAHRHTPQDLLRRVAVAPDNHTLAILVPDASSARSAESFGFPRENIHIWDTSKGIEEVGKEIVRTTETFYQARAAGIRSTKNLFTMNLGNLTAQSVKSKLTPLRSGEYAYYTVKKKSPIAQFVAFYEGQYVKGMSFYELTKPETVQAGKAVAIMDEDTGKVYVGHAARHMLGLPDYEVRVQPGEHKKYKIFVQSTSVNRNLVPGSSILVMRNTWL